ncbi:MAG TPA: alpha/beta hydrolase [Rhizomicrobium sp.]|nr:alpha/beta hydrolase [Rhizomicrobium sp.]
MNMEITPQSLRAAVGAQEPITWIGQLAATRRGKGPAVLCLHAIGHGARDFELLAERIGARFEVIALDWPGQGRSASDGVPASAVHYETLVAQAMDALGLDSAILIGNSIGGATALRFAAHNPARVRRLVLCDSGGLFAVPKIGAAVIRRFAAFFGAGERGRRWFGPVFRFYYKRVLTAPPSYPQRDRIIASGYEIAAPLRQAWESFARPEADIRALAEQIACPVWFAWAKKDSIIRWKAVAPMVPRFRNARVTHFEGAHAPFLEDPEHFARSFEEFAASL